MITTQHVRLRLIEVAMNILTTLQPRFAEGTLLRRALNRAVRELTVAKLLGPRIITDFARYFPNAFFIQIGSNDGDQLDPLKAAIHAKNWRGIMIEPVPYVFEGLKRNYGNNPRITLENVAISRESGLLPFFHLKKASAEDLKTLPRWYDALGSFSREVLLKHVDYIPDIAERVTTAQIPTITFDALCQRNQVTQVDLIHTDTEGHDFEILKTVDFSRYRPTLVMYEHHHFSPEMRQNCQQLMRDSGYAVFEEILDTWCLDLRNDSQGAQYLRRYWTHANQPA